MSRKRTLVPWAVGLLMLVLATGCKKPETEQPAPNAAAQSVIQQSEQAPTERPPVPEGEPAGSGSGMEDAQPLPR